MELLDKIKNMLAEQEMMDVDEIDEDTTFESLDLDSLSIADLVIACEEEFGITIDLDNPPKTFGELVRDIDEQAGAE